MSQFDSSFSTAKRAQLIRIQPGVQGGSYSQRYTCPFGTYLCSDNILRSSLSFYSSFFKSGIFPLHLILAIIWAGFYFISTLLLFGIGKLYFVYFDGITKLMEYSFQKGDFLTVTGAVIAIFSQLSLYLDLFFPKMKPAISLNPLFIAVYISDQLYLAQATKKGGYCRIQIVYFEMLSVIFESIWQFNFSTLARTQQPAKHQNPQRAVATPIPIMYLLLH